MVRPFWPFFRNFFGLGSPIRVGDVNDLRQLRLLVCRQGQLFEYTLNPPLMPQICSDLSSHGYNIFANQFHSIVGFSSDVLGLIQLSIDEIGRNILSQPPQLLNLGQAHGLVFPVQMSLQPVFILANSNCAFRSHVFHRSHIAFFKIDRSLSNGFIEKTVIKNPWLRNNVLYLVILGIEQSRYFNRIPSVDRNPSTLFSKLISKNISTWNFPANAQLLQFLSNTRAIRFIVSISSLYLFPFLRRLFQLSGKLNMNRIRPTEFRAGQYLIDQVHNLVKHFLNHWIAKRVSFDFW